MANALTFVATQYIVAGPWRDWLDYFTEWYSAPWLPSLFLRSRIEVVEDLIAILAQGRRNPVQYYLNTATIGRVRLEGNEWPAEALKCIPRDEDGQEIPGQARSNLQVDWSRAKALSGLYQE